MSTISDPGKCPEPGIYDGVDFDTYKSWPAVNNSSLSYATRSMAHYRWAPERQQSAAMWFGSLVHLVTLQPEEMHATYEAIPDCINEKTGKPYGINTKAYLDHIANYKSATGKQVVTQADFVTAVRMQQAVWSNDFARRTICKRGRSEVAVVWQDIDSGVWCKARADKWDGDCCIYDLKTTSDASVFEKSIAKFSYHRQAAFYVDGFEAITGQEQSFGIVAIEKDEPYGCRGAMMCPSTVEQGRREYKRLLAQIAECRASGEWPGYSDPRVWTLPAWAIEQCEDDVELTINGEVI